MKLLVLANNDVGLYRFRKELLQRLQKEGHELYLSLPQGDLVDTLIQEGCSYIETPIDRRGQNPVKDLGLFVRYFRMIRAVKPDLVVTYTVKPNTYGGIVCRLLKVPYAVNVTGLGSAFRKEGLLRKLVTAMYKAAVKKADTVFFENTQNRQVFLEEKIVSPEQCCILNGAGVNLEEFLYGEYPEDAEEMRFLFIGRVMEEKGIDTLIAATRKLLEQGVQCTLDVVGSFEEDYREKIRQCEAEGWMRYHGYQSDVRAFILPAHCIVLPSLHEGMANTNLESAAMGRPIITSDIPGCRETVVQDASGLLCRAGDPDRLCQAMKKMALLSRDDRKEMGLAGRRHMEQFFDKNKIVEKTVNRLFRQSEEG